MANPLANIQVLALTAQCHYLHHFKIQLMVILFILPLSSGRKAANQQGYKIIGQEGVIHQYFNQLGCQMPDAS